MGAAQDLDKPDLAAATAGLWDNRSNYDASGNVYPSTGGSGTSGAVLKSDQWRISVAGTLGGTAVSVGDVLVALVDTPGSTSSNWMVLQGNVVAFTGDSGSGGLEGLVPAPAAGDSAAGKFLKANGQWVAVSTSNLGSANLTSTDDARTFTLKSGGTATQNLQFLNSGGGNLLKLSGNSTIDFGSSANYINSNFHCNPATNTNFNVLRGTDVYIQSDVAAYTTYFRGSSWSKIIVLSHDAGQVSVAGSSAGFFALNNTGTESIIQRLDSNGAYILYRNSANANIFAIDANSAVAGIIGDFGVGAFGPYTARLYVKGSGSTSATTTALFQNSSSVACLTIKDDLSVTFGSVIELGHASDTTISRVSAGKIAVEGVNVVTISSTDTLTNKRVTPRVGTTTSSATPTINTDIVDYYELTAQAVDITSFTTNLSGTPTKGQKLWIAITGTAARAITWGASFEASTIALPTTTVSTNRLDVGFIWNDVTNKWRCVGSV